MFNSQFTTSMAALITPRGMAPCAIRTSTSCSLSGHRGRLINIGRATRLQDCVTLSCLRSSPRPDASTVGMAFDADSEVYCWRRSGSLWRMRASLGLACAQAATLCTQVVGLPRSRPRAAARPRA